MPLPTDIVEAELATRRQASAAVAMKIPLVHVESNVCDLVMNPPHEIPTSATDGKSNTKRTEELLGLPPSAYFYAGRACPDFGNTAFAFAAECEVGHTGSASPFDTGGLMSQRSHLKLRLNPNDGEAERVTFGKASTIPLDRWRETFGTFLTAHFDSDSDYWHKTPNGHNAEGRFELNTDWRAWTFEIRFSEGQSIHGRAAWCAHEDVMRKLQKFADEAPPTIPGDAPSALEQFFAGPLALEPAGTDQFHLRLEHWVREQVIA